MKKSLRLHGSRSRQAGFSLIELMIAMVIGMVVVGAVLAAYLGAGKSSRNGRAIAQITEDASIAMNVMRSSIGMVGYGKPTDVDNKSHFVKAYAGPGIFGCDAAFTAPKDAINALVCDPNGGDDSIAVAYEADKDNSVTNALSEPLDCLGNRFDKTGTYYLAYNRFYVSGDQLMCLGAGSNAAQALVDNVDSMQISYGVANQVPLALHQVARYETATSLQTELGAPGWDRVISVRICVVIKSTDNVLDQKVKYQGCNGEVTPPDGDLHMYRAFTTTIVLQNRLGDMR